MPDQGRASRSNMIGARTVRSDCGEACSVAAIPKPNTAGGLANRAGPSRHIAQLKPANASPYYCLARSL
jgi:hypothetical protein